MEKWQRPYPFISIWDRQLYWTYNRVLKLYKKEFPEIAGNFISHEWIMVSDRFYTCRRCNIDVFWGYDPAEYITIVSCPERCNEIVVMDIIL